MARSTRCVFRRAGSKRECAGLHAVWCALLLALAVGIVPAAARAQQAPAQLEVRVTDAAGKPLPDARVFVNGPLTSSALTPADGVIRFSDVDPGLYDLRVALGGYVGVDVRDVEVLAGRRKIVAVTLERAQVKAAAPGPVASPSPRASPAPGALTEIGRVRARPPVVTSVDVDEGNPVNRISENLADALDKIAGISVSQDQQSGTLTISLRNAANTVATLGGSPLLGGGASQLQTVAADLATGVSADTSGGGFGGSGGAVNFRTIAPTKTWQGQLSASYGTYERTRAQLSLSGTYGKLGIAAQHGTLGGDSVLTGLRFEDASGQTYAHDGAFARTADLLNLRYPIGHLNVTGLFFAGTSRSSPICTQWVTLLPCGYGPGGSLHNTSGSAGLTAQGQVGNVIVFANASTNTYTSRDDELGRVVAGIPSPYGAYTHGGGGGFTTNATLAIHRHTLQINAGRYTGSGRTSATGRFQTDSTSRYIYGFSVLSDTLKFSDRWSATLGYGINESLAQARSAADLAVTLTPSRNESLTLGIGSYGNGSNFVNTGTYADPAGAQYDCGTGQVRVNGPADAPLPGTSETTQLSYSRRGRRGSIRAGVYERVDRNTSLNTLLPLDGVPASELPPGYLDTIAAFFHGATVCGTQAFDPSRVYLYEQLFGPTQTTRGVDLSGQVVLGRAVIALPSYSIASSFVAMADPRLLAVGSPVIPGAQLPFTPLHKAGLIVDARQPRGGLEYIVNGTWVSGNNASALGPYVAVAAGATWSAPRGNLSFFVNNLFSADTGLFAGNEFAQPLPLRGGGAYVPVPNLLPPRTYTLLYTVRAGRQQ